MTADRMADHWWWRPGWQLGRRMYTWHFTFGSQPGVRELAAAYQGRLAALPGLDLVPARWLHLTTQGVGFADEVTTGQADEIVTRARAQLKQHHPQDVTVGPADVQTEAIVLSVTPSGGLAAVRNVLREAIKDVLGEARLSESGGWTPHVSVAYSNSTGPREPYEDAVAGGGAVQAVISEVELIVLGRDSQMYEWATYASVGLGK